ncbi:MAG: hypothetical protein AB2A00_17270 [Myxococcota bacterium]
MTRSGWLLALLLAAGCPSSGETAGTDGGAKGSKVVQGIRSMTPKGLRDDAGPTMIAFATPGGASLWAVDPRALTEVRVAVRTGRGTRLAEALERHPAVGPELLAKARAVSGPGPVAEQAEAALMGPLSLPSGGEHRPISLFPSGLTDALVSVSVECKQTVGQPGAVGRVLDGIGRTRVLLLLEGQDLQRYRACADAAVLPADASEAVRTELTRLRALLADGAAGKVAVMMALGDG